MGGDRSRRVEETGQRLIWTATPWKIIGYRYFEVLGLWLKSDSCPQTINRLCESATVKASRNADAPFKRQLTPGRYGAKAATVTLSVQKVSRAPGLRSLQLPRGPVINGALN